MAVQQFAVMDAIEVPEQRFAENQRREGARLQYDLLTCFLKCFSFQNRASDGGWGPRGVCVCGWQVSWAAALKSLLAFQPRYTTNYLKHAWSETFSGTP